MFYQIFALELKKNLKSPAFYIFFFIFFIAALIFTLTTDPYTQYMGVSHGKELHNAPIIIAQILTRMSVMGLLFTMVIIGRSVAKDFENNIHELVFSKPLKKIDYLGGRFLGSFVANLILFSAIILAFEIGILFLESSYSGPFQLGTYILPFVLIIIPNLLLMGGLLFGLATLTRKMISTYLASIAFVTIYAIVGVMLHRMDNETMKVLLDPFGISALTVYTQYWTTADMNSLLIPINSTFLFNRLIWLTVSILLLRFTYVKFEFVAFLEKKKKNLIIKSEKTEIIDYDIAPPVIPIASTRLFNLSQALSTSWRDFRRIVVHPAFLILTALALTEISANFRGGLGNQTGHMYPFTSSYLRQTIHIWIYMLPMTIFFGGMLVWKEKEYKTDEIFNTLPIPNWFSYINKLMTLTGIYILYLGLTIITGIFSQIVLFNYTDIELGLYFKHLFGVDFFIFLHMAIVVLFIQNFSPNKYVGFFWSALFFVADLMVFGIFEFDNYLLRYGRVPEFIYSNLNGFGHYGLLIFWYTIYWLLLGAIIAWITILMWRRTNENSLQLRFNYLRKTISRNQVSGILILVTMFIITGAFIGYNKYVLNPYQSEYDQQKMASDYEKKFSIYRGAHQPTITKINLQADLSPKERRAQILGEYSLFNHHNQSIKEIYVNLNDWNLSNLQAIEFNRSFTKIAHHAEFGFRVFELEEMLNPGDSLTMHFQYDILAEGFSENHPMNELVSNGTCLVLSSFTSQYFPLIGYSINNELIRDKYRIEFSLPEKDDAPKVSDADRSQCIVEISRPEYEAIISTSLDQTVISGGKLVDNWQDENRNYFHFKSDTIIENEVAIISGRYNVRREQYDGVNIEVYYHPEHNFNTTSILDGLRDSYDYGNSYFSKYPYTDLRIVEIPNYMQDGAARHFPTTFIWVESEGFITRYEENDIDIVYGIAAHENAHHWWAGIVTPAYSQGAFVLTETMCQYVMGMLTEKKFGLQTGRDYHLREMKSYLRRRKHDTEGEKSLVESSIRQSYLGYKKSSVVMYALQDYIGEDSVGKALERIVDKYGYRLDSFALASDLVEEFNKVTPDTLKYLVRDLFQKITLYENKLNAATYRQMPDATYEIELDIETLKFYSDSVGNQIEAGLEDYIYVGLLDEHGNAFYYEKHKFTQNRTSVTILTDQIPAKAGIDPHFLLIDRDVEDNLCEVEAGEANLATMMLEAPVKELKNHLSNTN